MRKSSILLLTLNTFSITGGIEKVCRIVGKALEEIAKETNSLLLVYSLHDATKDGQGNKYFSNKIFAGCSGNIKNFIIRSFSVKRYPNNIIILSHINLLPVGFLIKTFSPKTTLILIAHGIEVWAPLSSVKRFMMRSCDKVLAVSEFTKQKMFAVNQINLNKIDVLNNCLDPFLQVANPGKRKALLEKYNLSEEDRIMIAVTRYSSLEKYKGYDQVIKAMGELKNEMPNLKYLLIGKYDAAELKRINLLVAREQLEGKVKFAGFVSDADLADHFAIGNAFVMPSEKEGFGLVFIEAVYFGIPVIAGNKDGTRDALLNGQLGTLIDPYSISELKLAIQKVFKGPLNPDRKLLLEHFSFDVYKLKLTSLLNIR